MYNINATINFKVYLEENFPFDLIIIYVRRKNIIIDVAKHLAAINYSAIGFEDFPEVVIIQSVAR